MSEVHSDSYESDLITALHATEARATAAEADRDRALLELSAMVTEGRAFDEHMDAYREALRTVAAALQELNPHTTEAGAFVFNISAQAIERAQDALTLPVVKELLVEESLSTINEELRQKPAKSKNCSHEGPCPGDNNGVFPHSRITGNML